MATYKPKRKTDSGLEDIQIPYEMIVNPPAGITDIDTQYVRIWDLDTGIYRLTYSGTKYIYYYGATNTSMTAKSLVDKPIIYVNYYNSGSSEYKTWVSITAHEGTSLRIASGYTAKTYGSVSYKAISSLLTTGQVRNDLTYNQNNQGYALSAYQGYLLDQRLQAVENGSGGSSASIYKHLINVSHSVEKDGTTYYFTHTIECYSTDNTQATDASSANAYIGGRASALSSGYYGAGNDVWCINGSIQWNGGYHKIKFGAVINGAFVDFSTSMFDATYSDTVTEL